MTNMSMTEFKYVHMFLFDFRVSHQGHHSLNTLKMNERFDSNLRNVFVQFVWKYFVD